MKIVYIYLCSLVRLHFSVGRYRRYGVPWSSKSFQFTWAWILFAQHVHRRSRVDCEFSLFWIYRRRCRHYPGFSRRAERIFFILFEFLDILWQVPCFSAGASLLLHGFILRSILEFWSPQNSDFCMTPCDGHFLSRIFAWRIVVLENLTAWSGPNCPTSCRIDFLWGPSWETQPNWTFSFTKATDPLSQLFLWLYWAARHHQCVWKDKRSPYLHPDSDL